MSTNNIPDEDDEQATEDSGDFFTLQQDLITLIEDFRATHLVDNRKMSLKKFAEYSGISVPILTAITNGNRWAAKTSRETVEKLASALEIPVLQVYILSGFIKNDDVVYTTNIQNTLELIYRQMSKDKNMTYKLPKKSVWNTWPESAKIAFAMMYEDLTNNILLRYITLPEPQ
ncbi:helix-turn-helix domain-containing protein [Rhodoferax antarcticus]|nr:helix-turn-helix transcriptional regulator [Rhodoferax antarcticus]